jgi:4-carboxymuconolactone decarboxylase
LSYVEKKSIRMKEFDRMSAATPADRMPPIPEDQQSPSQKRAVASMVSGSRRDVRGAAIALLRSPELLERTQQVGELLRFRSVLPRKLRELAALATARFWQQAYEWHSHAASAREAGLSATAIDRLALDGEAVDGSEDEQAVLQFCHELQRTHGVSDTTYERAKQLLGEQGVVELCALCGHHTLQAMVMNVARTPAPEGARVPFPPPEAV